MTDDTARTALLNRDRKRLAAEARALRANLRRRKAAHPTRKSTRTGLMEELGRAPSVRTDDGTRQEGDAPDPSEPEERAPDRPRIPAAPPGERTP